MPENESVKVVLVDNPTPADYDGMFIKGTPVPRGYRQTSDKSVVVRFAIFAVAAFLGIAFVLSWLF